MLPSSRWALQLSRVQRVSARTLSTTTRSHLDRRSRIPKRALPRIAPSRGSPAPNQSSKPPASSQAPQTPSGKSHPDPNAVSSALRAAAQSDHNSLLAPVHIPEDPDGVLRSNHPAVAILGNSSVVIQRQLEMMNLLVGFEQANKYVIMDAEGGHVGYLIEQDLGMGNAMARQMFKTHRSFTAHVLDRTMREVLRIHRPFSYINSRISIYDPVSQEGGSDQPQLAPGMASSTNVIPHDLQPVISPLPLSSMRTIGEAQQQWAPLRRKYNLFYHHHAEELSADQFAAVDEPFLSWDFNLRGQDGSLVGSVNRNFAGLGRELFTDTGVYALRMDSAHLASQGDSDAAQTLVPSMSLDQRAVMLATAVSIDFDYFSRHGGTGVGFLPLWMVGGGGEAAGAGAAGAAGAEAAGVGAAGGAIGEATTAAGAGAIARGVGGMGAAEAAGGAVTGAGAAAGMGAMRGMGSPDEQSPQQQQYGQDGLGGGVSPSDYGAWGEDGTSQNDDWDQWGSGGGGGSGGSPTSGGGDVGGGGGGGEGGGSGVGDVISDIFGL